MRILFPDEILVEPMCLFDLEADSWDRHEFFGGYVDNKSTTLSIVVLGGEDVWYQDKSSRTCSKEAN